MSVAVYELRTARRHAAAGWLALLRRWYWIFVRRHETEICECGRPVGPCTGSWWEADDDLWISVAEPTHISEGKHGRRIGNGVLCPPCFTAKARAKGVWVHWRAVVE